MFPRVIHICRQVRIAKTDAFFEDWRKSSGRYEREHLLIEPVITFIHREQVKLQEFLRITTTKNNNLKITEDHLLFVEKNGLSQAIPARVVKIGDTVYVKQNGLMRTATVQDISTVYEKGVYAPVTRSGTIYSDQRCAYLLLF